MAVDTSIVNKFITALKAKFELKSNKKDDISGTFEDSDSYATVRAIKNYVSSTIPDISGKEDTSNKITSWSATASDTKYPAESLVKSALNAKQDASTAFDGDYEKLSNKPTIPTATNQLTNNSGFLTATDISGKLDKAQGSTNKNKNVVTDANGNIVVEDKPAIPTKTSQLTNDSNFLTSHQDISGKENTSNKVTSISSSSTDTQYPSAKLLYDQLQLKQNSASLAAVATSGDYNDLDNQPSIPSKVTDLSDESNYIKKSSSSAGLLKPNGTVDNNTYLTQADVDLSSKTVAVREQATAESGYLKTYVISQGGTDFTTKINIPKDFLVKSASVQTVTTANQPVSGYRVNDKYLDFVINTKDGSGTDDHVYVNVKDLIDTYTAGSGLTLSSNEFSIGNGAISKTMLAGAVQNSLGYADNWNSSVAKTITQDDINNWNDPDTEIAAYLNAIAENLNPTQ